MNKCRCATAVASLVAAACAFGQAGSIKRDIPAALLAEDKLANGAEAKGRAFLAEGKVESAIQAFREAVKIHERIAKKFGGFTSSGNYGLAKALTLANRPDEALGAYKKAFRWNPKKEDIESNGPPFTDLGSDYAILLAKSGYACESNRSTFAWFPNRRGCSSSGQRSSPPR